MVAPDEWARNASSNDPDDFWSALDRLIANSKLVIERPKGSRHPRYANIIYPLDYGYLDETSSMDGGGIDVWVGSRTSRDLDAVIFTVDLKKRDFETKLLLGCTGEEKRIVLELLNENSMRAILVRRRGSGQRSIARPSFGTPVLAPKRSEGSFGKGAGSSDLGAFCP